MSEERFSTASDIWQTFKATLYRVKEMLGERNAEKQFYDLPFELRALAYSVADRWQAPGHHDHEVMAQDIGIAIAAAIQIEREECAARAQAMDDFTAGYGSIVADELRSPTQQDRREA